MNTYLRAMIAGFIATVVLSILMIGKSMMGIMPALNPVHMLSSMAHERMGMPDTPMVGLGHSLHDRHRPMGSSVCAIVQLVARGWSFPCAHGCS